MLDTPTCGYKEKNSTHVEEVGYVIQKTDRIEMDALSCKINFHRLIHNCDYLGSSEAVEGDDIGYNIEVSRDQCITLIRKDTFTTTTGATKTNLKKNAENVIRNK